MSDYIVRRRKNRADKVVGELVRCGECIHFAKLGDGWGRCNVHSRTAQTIDFCSWAERKENE